MCCSCTCLASGPAGALAMAASSCAVLVLRVAACTHIPHQLAPSLRCPCYWGARVSHSSAAARAAPSEMALHLHAVPSSQQLPSPNLRPPPPPPPTLLSGLLTRVIVVLCMPRWRVVHARRLHS